MDFTILLLLNYLTILYWTTYLCSRLGGVRVKLYSVAFSVLITTHKQYKLYYKPHYKNKQKEYSKS